MFIKKNNISYLGVFIDPPLQGQLDRTIPNQHITISFNPSDSMFLETIPHLGEECEITVLGYGNDGKNEGLLVSVAGNFVYQGAEQQHITLSVSKDGRPVNTGKLVFDQPIPTELGLKVGDVLTGKIGAFVQAPTQAYGKTYQGPVYDVKLFEENLKISRGELVHKTSDVSPELKEHLARHCLGNHGSLLVMQHFDLSSFEISINGSKANVNSHDLETMKSFWQNLKELQQSGGDVQLGFVGCPYVIDPNETMKVDLQQINVTIPDELIIEDGVFIAKWEDGSVITNIDCIDTYMELSKEYFEKIHLPTEEELTEEFTVPKIGE